MSNLNSLQYLYEMDDNMEVETFEKRKKKPQKKDPVQVEFKRKGESVRRIRKQTRELRNGLMNDE